MRQVEGEVDDTTAGCCKAGFGKEGAEQEALHDCSSGESQQEQEEDEWIAIMKDSSMLKPKRTLESFHPCPGALRSQEVTSVQ